MTKKRRERMYGILMEIHHSISYGELSQRVCKRMLHCSQQGPGTNSYDPVTNRDGNAGSCELSKREARDPEKVEREIKEEVCSCVVAMR